MAVYFPHREERIAVMMNIILLEWEKREMSFPVSAMESAYQRALEILDFVEKKKSG